MPRPRVPKLCLHKGTGQARVLLKGRHVYLGKHGTPEADEKYRRIVAEFLRTDAVPAEAAPRSAAPATPAAGGTIDEIILVYWKWAQSHYVKDGEPTSEIGVLKVTLRTLRQLYGSTPAEEFGPLKLKAYREQLVRDGLSRPGVNERVERIKRVFKWAVSEELVGPTVHQALATVTGLQAGRTTAWEPDPVEPVEVPVVEAALPHLPPVVADMVRLQLLTGMRPGEVCGLKPIDVDRSKEVWAYRPASHKTQHHGKARTVFVGTEAQAVLGPYLENRPADAFCFSPKEAERQRRAAATAARVTPASCGNTVGSNRKKAPARAAGGRYTTASYRRCVQRTSEKVFPLPAELAVRHRAINRLPNAERAAVKAAVKAHRAKFRWSPNQLRHTCATLLRAKYGIELTRTVLGHSDIKTSEIYAERDLAAAAHIMGEVG